MVEPLITLAKIDSIAKRRLAYARLRDVSVVEKLFAELGPRFKARAGGYTRILKMEPRPGDSADMALMQLVESAAAGRERQGCEGGQGREAPPRARRARRLRTRRLLRPSAARRKPPPKAGGAANLRTSGNRVRIAMSLASEFKEFAMKGSVVDLAVGVIVGARSARSSPRWSATYLCRCSARPSADSTSRISRSAWAMIPRAPPCWSNTARSCSRFSIS